MSIIKTLRLRLAILTSVLAGIALCVFALGTWWTISNLHKDRLDSEIRTRIDHLARRPLEFISHPLPIRLITIDMGIEDPQDLILLQHSIATDHTTQSQYWPAELDVNALPWPTHFRAHRVSFQLRPEQSTDSSTTGAHLCKPSERHFSGPPRPNNPLRRPATPPTLPPPPHVKPHDRNNVKSTYTERKTSIILPGLQFRPLEQPNIVESYLASEPLPVTETAQVAQLPEFYSAEDQKVAPPPHPRPFTSGPVQLNTRIISKTIDGQNWRIGLVVTRDERLALGINTRVIAAEMQGIRNALFAALPLAILFISVGSWLIAGRAIRPIRSLTLAASNVNAEGLYQRIASQGNDQEFVELIAMFNAMLARLERSFKQAHRFSADAAHELKTPLAILQGQLEQAINSVTDGSPIQSTLASILDEVRRLSTISRKLLLLSQADAGRLNIYRQPFDLSKALNDLIEDASMLAPHLNLSAAVTPSMVISADTSLLRMIFHNLLSNAIKYNVQDGWIRITAQMKAHAVIIRFSNAAAEIPEEERNKLFERFFRADSAHGRTVDGSGLGLSLSREIAKAHGGDLFLDSSARGSIALSLRLPKPQ